jgi:hypothetical protein
MIFSTDGGQHWALSMVPQLVAKGGLLSCADAQHCVTIESTNDRNGNEVASGVLTTDDGGQTWSEYSPAGLTPLEGVPALNFDSVSCSTTSDCWAGGQSYGSLCNGSCPYVPTQGVLAATTNGGQSWSTVQLPEAPTTTLQYGTVFPVSCVIGASCFAVGSLELSQLGSSRGLTSVEQDVVLSNSEGSFGSAASGSSTGTASGQQS